MSGSYSTINSYIAATVTLGQGGYLSSLSITGAGTIAPTAYGAVALDAPAPGLILNAGTIAGAAGVASQSRGATGAQG